MVRISENDVISRFEVVCELLPTVRRSTPRSPVILDGKSSRKTSIGERKQLWQFICATKGAHRQPNKTAFDGVNSRGKQLPLLRGPVRGAE